MPYIKPEDRLEIEIDGDSIKNVGQLNYVLSTIIDKYLGDEQPRYADINAVMGVIECAKLELYRRIAAPYEDSKMQENGDVYNFGNTIKPKNPTNLRPILIYKVIDDNGEVVGSYSREIRAKNALTKLRRKGHTKPYVLIDSIGEEHDG